MCLEVVEPWQILLILVLLLLLVTPIIALVDILKSNFGGNDKLIWVIIVLVGSFVGALLYYIIGRKQKI